MDIFGICYAYDKVSANNASSFPHGSQDARPQIYQINRQTNSFQNMCDML